MRIGRIMVALAALPLAAGCTAVVGGAARPAPGLTLRHEWPAGTAVNVAHRMMDKVSSLT